jgi:hypothetical protein
LTDDRAFGEDEVAGPYNRPKLRKLRFLMTGNISKQVISRYEETEYQTVAIARLQEILDAIGIKALVTLSA